MSLGKGFSKIRGIFQVIFFFSLLLGVLYVLWPLFSSEVTKNISPDSNEFQIRYTLTNFEYTPDPEFALAVLTNPLRYKREFDGLVRELNVSILNHVAARLGLPEQAQEKIRQAYEKHHSYLSELYYTDIISNFDSTSFFAETWYETRAKNAVTALNRVASSYTCFLVNQIISSVIGFSGNSTIIARGEAVAMPCTIAMKEAFEPVLKIYEVRAAIEDFQRSRGIFEEKVEQVITELATVEKRDKKGLSREEQTLFLGTALSNSRIEVSAISIIKVGFRLNEFFAIDLDTENKRIVIQLPEPSILSHEFLPRIDRLEIGWLRELTENQFNENFELLRSEFRREASMEETYSRARQQAESFIRTIFQPILHHFDQDFILDVQFGKWPQEDQNDHQKTRG